LFVNFFINKFAIRINRVVFAYKIELKTSNSSKNRQSLRFLIVVFVIFEITFICSSNTLKQNSSKNGVRLLS